MILKIPSILVVLLLLLSACSSKNFTFSGETDNWSAELKVTQTNDEYETQEFKLQFKGKDINSVGEITYNIDTNAGGFGKSGVKLNKNGFLIDRDEANPTNAKVIEDSEVKVKVEWNGKTETILLSKN
ncbi:hypothetical protein HFZ78_19460 [Priestia megaterium]|uniref:Lipoprotein n=1 Tax=Priestia megaterium TaxID=1404 RepID=A0A6H1PCV3_PRIMG|nr:hypothetical protein HFZ78_19460 [Priestia megaterium]